MMREGRKVEREGKEQGGKSKRGGREVRKNRKGESKK